jgi:hypothetical protein
VVTIFVSQVNDVVNFCMTNGCEATTAAVVHTPAATAVGQEPSATEQHIIAAEMQSTTGLQLTAYKHKKAVLAHIMREFSSNNLHFKTLCGEDVFVRQFQLLKSAGEKIEDVLRGDQLVFRVGINKKTSSYTESMLFIPYTEVTASGKR